MGDRILVHVQKIFCTDLERLTIRADVRSVSTTDNRDKLKKCLPQCRYAGRVTDIRNGISTIAHSCYDLRRPGKKDDVSFVAEVPDTLVAENLNGQQRMVKTYVFSPDADPEELKEPSFDYDGFIYGPMY